MCETLIKSVYDVTICLSYKTFLYNRMQTCILQIHTSSNNTYAFVMDSVSHCLESIPPKIQHTAHYKFHSEPLSYSSINIQTCTSQ